MGTLTCTAQQVLDVARHEVGNTESPAGSNKQKYGAAFDMNGVPWCGLFTGWSFLQVGVRLHDLGIDFWYTPTYFREAVEAGWVHVPISEAQPGDVVFFDFPGDNVDRIQHVGFVESRIGTVLNTIEGNTSSGPQGSQSNGGGVFRRQRGVGVVKAILRPPYAPEKPTLRGRVSDKLVPAKKPTGEYGLGDKGAAVKAIQRKLNAVVPGKKLAVDGEIGPKTEARIKAYQRSQGLDADGIAGRLTLGRLFR